MHSLYAYINIYITRMHLSHKFKGSKFVCLNLDTTIFFRKFRNSKVKKKQNVRIKQRGHWAIGFEKNPIFIKILIICPKLTGFQFRRKQFKFPKNLV